MSNLSIIINRGAFLDALELAASVALKRSPKPTLSCCRLLAADDRLSVSATSLDQTVVIRIAEVQIESVGEILVDAGKILAVVKSADDDHVTVRSTGTMLEVRSSSGVIKLPVLASTEWPPEPKSPPEGVVVNAVHFAAAVKAVSNTMDIVSETGPMTGVLVKWDAGTLTAAGLCSHIGSERKIDAAISGKTGDRCILPEKSIGLIVRALAGRPKDETISISIDGNVFKFGDPDSYAATSTLEGIFPPYEQIFPTDSPIHAAAEVAAIASALHRVGLVVTDDARAITIDAGIKGMEFSVTTKGGDARESYACKVDGGELKIHFNPQLFARALKTLDTPDVRLGFTAFNRPMVFESGRTRGLVMPVNPNA